MNTKKVIVLGTEYEIMLDAPEELMAENSAGATDPFAKKIYIAKMEPDRDSTKNLEAYKKKVLRHEIVHAFFFESGLHSNSPSIDIWGIDEANVDWIAIQAPKLLEAFKEAGAL